MNRKEPENHYVVQVCGRHALSGQLMHVPTKGQLADDIRRELSHFAGYEGYRDELEEDVSLQIDRIVKDRTHNWSKTEREAARVYYHNLAPRYVDAMIRLSLTQRLGRSVSDLGWFFMETFARLRRFPWITKGGSHG